MHVSLRRPAAVLLAALLVVPPVVLGDPPPALAAPSDVPEGFAEQVVFSGLNQPTNVEFAADGRVFVAEKSGVIKMFDSLDDTRPVIIADLQPRVHNYWDRGLIGMALHPDFPDDPRIYVHYTYDAPIGGTAPTWGTEDSVDDDCPTPPGPLSDGCVVSGRLSTLTLTGTEVTEKVMINDWCMPFPSHSVGTVAFGPDGLLYASGGEGANFAWTDYGQDGFPDTDVTPDNVCGDPPFPAGTELVAPDAEGGALRAQDVRTSGDPAGLGGTIIRIDPDTAEAPADNPMAASPDLNTRRIIAYGMRNPFRFTFRPGTDELWAGDVGWDEWEEINRITRDDVPNFGWPCYEGLRPMPDYQAARLTLCERLYDGTEPVTEPYYTYNHRQPLTPGEPCTQGSSSIANLMFYPGGAFPDSYDDALFFSDHNRKCIWVMRAGADGLPDPDTVEVFAHGDFLFTELQLGPDGDMYGVDLIGGRILRYVYDTDNHPPVAAFTATPRYGTAPLTVTLDAGSSTDPDGDPLSYAWDLDGDGAHDDGTGVTVTHTYSAVGTVTPGLRVDDGNGGTDTASTEIQVGNTPPVVTMAAPVAGRTWAVGETVEYAGQATDAEDAALPDSAYRWSLLVQHCPQDCHAHEITRRTGRTGSFVAPDHEYPSHLELRLTVTDSAGLATTVSRRLDPRTVDLTLDSDPPGLVLSAFFEWLPAPFTRTVIVGSSLSITAITPQESGGRVYEFASWSDGGAAVHNITAPAEPATYTATFREKPNLAEHRRTRASSSQAPSAGPHRATDGRTGTAWISGPGARQSITVDLGRSRDVGRALLRWGDRPADKYTVQTSPDGRTWTPAYTVSAGDGGVDQNVVPAAATRYLRIAITGGPRSGGRYVLQELEVYDG
jgi:glucose/arabinose dehydrogenase/PKD repeat protein